MKLVLIVALLGVAMADVPENRRVHDKNLFQGDIVLTPLQRVAVDTGRDPTEVGRGAFRGNLWPNGVMPYTIASSLSE
ncbi:uncharacterized protein LOC5512101 [Nematostella vectensis]|uniref:uncharacterized protein LOC5512101 n=1 Tax=Nematostella vectensis TaxID=45351 RepID=UPI0020772C58|nr:uncharacterized protein LOC5512101 [Nematostella vectensis]